MAIYKNREVAVISPTTRPNPPQTIVIQYQDGSYETVSIGQIYFTDDEKKALIKNHPSDFNDVNTITDDDLKAVRAGIAPSTDPSYKEQAQAEVSKDVQDESKPTPQPVETE